MAHQILNSLSTLALCLCLFLSIWAYHKSAKNRAYFFLMCLLWALAIRLLKSLIIIFWSNASNLIPAVGLLGMSMIGVFLLWHVQAILNGNFSIKKRDYLHFLPGTILVIWPFFNISDTLIFYQYVFAVVLMLAYIIYASFLLYETKSGWYTNKPWFQLLLGGIAGIWAVFLLQLFTESLSAYIVITLVASLTLFAISFFALKQQGNLFRLPEKQNLELKEIAQKIEMMLSEKKLFKDPNLNIQKLAETLKIPAYLVSKTINSHFQKTFPELIKKYRIQESELLLASAQYQNYTMEGIAFECGFQSVSAFYTAFKNQHQTSPAAYQKLHFTP